MRTSAQLLTRPAIIDSEAVANRMRVPVMAYVRRSQTLMQLQLSIDGKGKTRVSQILSGDHEDFSSIVFNAFDPVRMIPAVEEGRPVSSDLPYLLRFALSDTSYDRNHDSADMVIFPRFIVRNLIDTSAWPPAATTDADFGIVLYNEDTERWMPRDSMPGMTPAQFDSEEFEERLSEEKISVPIKLLWNYLLVRVLITADGALAASEVVMTDDLRLNAAAKRALNKVQFVPATRNGSPIASWMAIPVAVPFSVHFPERNNEDDGNEFHHMGR